MKTPFLKWTGSLSPILSIMMSMPKTKVVKRNPFGKHETSRIIGEI
jgi:hypothetical protein